MKNMKIILSASIVLLLIGIGVNFLPGSGANQDHGHDHGTDDSGHSHSEGVESHEIKDEHGHGDSVEKLVHLHREDIERFGIEVASVGSKNLQISVTVLGEIKFNEDRLAHIVPRVGGIVQSVKKTLGDKVEEGEVLASIESRELTDIKTNYLSSLERLKIAKVILDREEQLYKDQISSEQDYLEARNVYAEAKINMLSAEQKLRAIGFKQEYLDKLADQPKENLSIFEITAPFSGRIIEKHFTLGEMVRDDTDAFVLADLDTVWVDLQVYQKDIAHVKKGQTVKISSQHLPETTGVISYVSPVLDEKTRTALTRVVLDNSSGLYKPGTFVTAEVLVDDLESKLVVKEDVIQQIDDKPCVFVKSDEGFRPRPVTIGRTGKNEVEIVSGLEFGEEIVTRNNFRLKAELEKTDASCSDHGHAH